MLYQYGSNQMADGSFPVYLRVTKNRKRKYISLKLACQPEQWDSDNDCFIKNKKVNIDFVEANRFIEKKVNEAKEIIEEFERKKVDFTLNQFEEQFLNKTIHYSVEEYFWEHIIKLKEQGKTGNANAYLNTLKLLNLYLKTFPKLTFNDIDYKFVKGFHEFLEIKRRVNNNTIKYYMKTLRSLYRKAVDDGLAKSEFSPFDKYKISALKEEVVKRYLPIEYLKKIKNAEFAEPHLEWTQKVFMFSYYTMGMNFIDMGNLKKTDIIEKDGKDGVLKQYITYKRAKTHKLYEIRINKDIQELLDFFKSNYPDYGYLVPIVTVPEHEGEKLYNHIRNRSKRFNTYLKTIGERLEIPHPISSYYARHSFAMTLKNKGVSTAIISEALGHETEEVTQIYLDSFQNDEVSDAIDGLLD